MSLVVSSPLQPAHGTLRLDRPGRPYTLAEVDAATDAGSEWWEADEGVLIVHAAATDAHHHAICGLMRSWNAWSADRWQVRAGPQRVVLDERTWVQPDVALWPFGSLDFVGGGSTPAMVAEVLSPATARRDRRDKPGLYGRAGVAWLVLFEPYHVPTVELYQLVRTGEVRRAGSAVGREPLVCPLSGADLTPATIVLA